MTSELARIFQYCEGQIETRTLPSRKRNFWSISEIDNIEYNRHEDAYFGVATRDGKGGTKENIVSIPAVWCDVDFKDTPRQIAKDRLSKFPFKPSVIIKSGGGVHLYWLLKEPATKTDIPAIEDINHRIAAALGGDTNACDAARILRIPNSINYKYNPPVTCQTVSNQLFEYDLDDFLDILPPVELPKQTSLTAKDWLPEAMSGATEGNRNSTGARIAGYWINKVSPGDVLRILETWNRLNTPPLPQPDIETIAKSVSRYEPTKTTCDISNVYTADKMLEAYQEHIRTLKQNKFITGISEIDKRIRGIAGGEVLTIIARSGAFKTAMLQNLLLNYTQNSAWAAVFFSIEMPVASVTERYLQIIFDEPGREVETMFSGIGEQADPESFKDVCDEFRNKMKNLFIIPSRVGLTNIQEYVKKIEKEYRIKVGVIGIDYLGLMDGYGKSEYEIVSQLATGTKQTAKMLGIPIVLLCQTSRKGGTGTTEIMMDMARSSGQIEEAADTVLGLFKIDDPTKQTIDENGDTVIGKSVIAKILKNRKGRDGEMFKLSLEPTTFKLTGYAEKYEIQENGKRGF